MPDSVKMKQKCMVIALVSLALLFHSCAPREDAERGMVRVVFKHGMISGDYDEMQAILKGFERENPGITVKDEILPASTDEQHQFYVTNLEGESADFDVLGMDVIWVPEFARAGWLRDIGHLLSEKEKEDIFPGPLEAVTYKGRVWAVPWYIDAGVLYYRKDLLEKHRAAPPETWAELCGTAARIMAREKGMYGFIWQGKQYEGLVCNALEYFWGNGGGLLDGGKVVIDCPENAEALRFMRDLIVLYRVSPPLVTTVMEEPSRLLFGSGKAVFMRNWPYAWNIFQRPDSAVRGKVGVAKLPSFKKGMSASALGGWQIGVNRYAKCPLEAEKFVRYLTSPPVQKDLALALGYRPTRRSLYRDRDLVAAQPFTAGLYEVFMRARPRPVTPYYMMLTQVMQPEFSAAVNGIKSPEEALRSARLQMEHIMGAGR